MLTIVNTPAHVVNTATEEAIGTRVSLAHLADELEALAAELRARATD